jgi:hypothetical protein
MKRIGFFILAGAIVAVIVGSQLIPKAVDASIFSSGRRGQPNISTISIGYTAAVVESTFINDPNTNKTLPYSGFECPTGYHYEKIEVCNAAAGAAQTVAIRFWASATDSTSLGGLHTVYLASADSYCRVFPIHCLRATLSLIADTDDVYVIGYPVAD